MATAISVVVLLAVAAAPLSWIWENWVAGPSFVDRHRDEADTYCRVDPELKFRTYPLADGTDPAPDLDAFEYCVAAYISHLPPDDERIPRPPRRSQRGSLRARQRPMS